MANQINDSVQTDFSFIMPSLRQDVDAFSAREGVSLPEFINVALAERLAHLRHEEWMSKRKPVTEETRRRFLAILDKSGSDEVEPGDELPEGYVPLARS